MKDERIFLDNERTLKHRHLQMICKLSRLRGGGGGGYCFHFFLEMCVQLVPLLEDSAGDPRGWMNRGAISSTTPPLEKATAKLSHATPNTSPPTLLSECLFFFGFFLSMLARAAGP